jgi:hypothetical protein
MEFGLTGVGTSYGFLYLRRVAVFDSALTDAQLQTVTT